MECRSRLFSAVQLPESIDFTLQKEPWLQFNINHGQALHLKMLLLVFPNEDVCLLGDGSGGGRQL